MTMYLKLFIMSLAVRNLSSPFWLCKAQARDTIGRIVKFCIKQVLLLYLSDSE